MYKTSVKTEKKSKPVKGSGALLSNDEISLLNIIYRKITSILNSEEIISTVYNNLNGLMDAAGFGIGLYNNHKNVIEYSNYIEKNTVLPFNEESCKDKNSLSVWCFDNQKEIFINDFRVDSDKYVKNVSIPDHGEIPKSLIYLPLSTATKKLGVITVQSFRKHAYTDYHVNILRNIAAYTAIALENALSFKKIKDLSLVASKTTNFVLIADAEDKIEWVNDGFCDLTGFSEEEVIGKIPVQLLSGAETEFKVLEKIYHIIFDLKQSFNGELTLYKKNEEKFIAAVNITPILDNEGNLEKYFIIGNDISEKISYQNEIKYQRDFALKKKEVLAETIVKLKKGEDIIKRKNEQLEQLSHVVKNVDNAVMIISPDGIIEWVNESFSKLYGYSMDDFTKNGKTIYETTTNKKIINPLKKAIQNKRILKYDVELTKKNGQNIWIRTTWTPVFDKNNNLSKFIGIDADISKQKGVEEKLKHINSLILKKNKLSSDSIRNAKRIQKAILPSEELINKNFKDHFILYRPKDVISGDFYWFEKHEDNIFFAVGDCTGHGVPGALLSVLCSNALTKSVRDYNICTPSKILDKTADLLHDELSNGDDNIKDGMDIALCSLNLEKGILEYAGANNSIFLISNNELKEIKSDLQPIGYFPKRKAYKNHEINIKEGDVVYLFSDGYADQFGGKNKKKFYYAPFKKLLERIHKNELSEQKVLLDEIYTNWKGNNDQTDDICVWGIKI